MKHTLLHQSIVLFLVMGAFLFAPYSVNAETLTIPQQLDYEGLTFLQPLNFSQTKQISVETTTLAFGTTPNNNSNITETKEVLGTITLAPSPDETTQTESTDAITPTPTVSVAPSDAPSPTAQPTTSTQTPQYTPAAQSNTGGLNADKLFSMVNSYRQSKGLTALQQDDRSCQLAKSRAPEIAGEIDAGTMHSGLRARNLPYWNTENIISMRSEDEAFNWWINDTIHREAIEGKYTYSCVACSGNSCAEEFTNFQPK